MMPACGRPQTDGQTDRQTESIIANTTVESRLLPWCNLIYCLDFGANERWSAGESLWQWYLVAVADK